MVHIHVGFPCYHLSRNLVPIISCHSFSWFLALSFVLELHLILLIFLMHFLVCFVDDGNIFLALNLFSFASDPCDCHLFFPLWDTMCVFMLLMKITIFFLFKLFLIIVILLVIFLFYVLDYCDPLGCLFIFFVFFF